MNSNNKILALKEEIDSLKEYLYSDVCKQCGEAVIKLENIYKELDTLMKEIEP